MSLQGERTEDLRTRAINFLSQIQLKATEERIERMMRSIAESDLKIIKGEK